MPILLPAAWPVITHVPSLILLLFTGRLIPAELLHVMYFCRVFKKHENMTPTMFRIKSKHL